MSDIAAPPAAGGTTPAPASTPAAKPVATPEPKAREQNIAPNSRHADTKPADAELADKTAAEVKKEIERRKYKGRVDGQDREYELSDDEVAVRLQKGEASEKRMQEAAEIRKAAQMLVEDLRKDPWSVLQDPTFGINLEEIAEQRLAEKYRAESLPEDQRKAYELEKQVKAYQDQESRRKETEKLQHQKQMEADVYKREEARFMAAADKHGLPKDLDTLAAMAEVALMNHEYGIELNEDQLAMEVLAKQDKPLAGLKKLKGGDLLKKLGDDVVNEVLRAKVAEFKGKQINPQPPAPPAQEGGDEKPNPFERKTLSMREWRDAMRKR